MKRKFNINNYIYIQITELGWKHLQKTVGEDYIKHCIKTEPYEVIVNGETWYRFQAHHVMRILHGGSGFNLLYNPTVMFDESELQTL